MARRLGVEDWWNTLACSWSVPVSPLIEQLVVNLVVQSCGISETSPDHIINSRGRVVLKRKSQQLYDELDWSVNPDQLSLEDTILVWHIATDLYLRWYKAKIPSSNRYQKNDLAKAVEVLSNYMLFLLAARPHMLPPSTRRNEYVEMCFHLTSLKYNSAEDLRDILQRYGDALDNPGAEFELPYETMYMSLRWAIERNIALRRGSQLATKVIGRESLDSPSGEMLELIAEIWAEMLCYVSSRCSAYSHTKQLSDGGELITVAAFLIEYLKRGLLKTSSSTSPDSHV